ncbi:MAG TPA: DUF6686 family protein [Ohtaekwangia sp.]
MHQQNAFEIIAESTNGYFGRCTCCHEFNFVYKNVVLAFQQDELLRFGEWLIEYRYHNDTYLALPHGRTRVYRPLTNLFLAFHDNELDELGDLFSQVQIVLEARHLVKGDRSAFDITS